MAMFEEVAAVRAALPTAVNLLASAVRPGDGPGKWMHGMVWRSELCPDYQGYNPCSELEEPPEEGGDGLNYNEPVAYRVTDECSLLSGRFDEERVTRLANAVASFVAARELWTGSLTTLAPYDLPNGGATDQVNPYLEDGNATEVPAPEGEDIIAAFAELEEQVRVAARGQQAFIHAPIGLVNRVAHQLRRVGNELRTATDGIVVADAGYPGSGGRVLAVGEVETVTLTGGPTGGTFTLTFQGQTTAGIAFNAAASAVQAALIALSNLAPGDVTVTGANGGPWTVSFAPALGNVTQMTGSGASLTGGTAPAVQVATTVAGVTAVAPSGTTWIYGTGPVIVRLGPVAAEIAPVSTIDRATNRRRVYGDRMFAVAFDTCAQFAMNVVEPAP